ncbi:MAG: glycosyltransferase [Rikenellaceae bacterium]
MNFISSIFDSLGDYIREQSLSSIVNTFWYMFYIEIPRFYILDIYVLIKLYIQRHTNAQREEAARIELNTLKPFISIIIPGNDEGEHIYRLITSLNEQTYQNFEVVVVDDGSDDNTPIICRSLIDAGLIDRFYSVDERGGKASAANLAMHDNDAEFIVHIDADSSLDRDALEQLLIPFYADRRVGAVGGCIKVRNINDTFCTTMQSLEYIETIQMGRTVNAELGIYRIVSGAFGAFRADVLRQVGYWDVGPGLDGDLTQKIRKAGYRIAFARKSICLTTVPESFAALYKQRQRWSKSLVRFRLRKHNNVFNLLSANFRAMNLISNIDNILFNFIFDIVWLVYLVTLIANNIGSVTDVLVLKFLITIPLAIVSFLMCMTISERRNEEIKLLPYTIFQSLFTSYYLRFNRLVSALSELFFFTSYRDIWNPTKSSRIARHEQI